VESPSPTVTSSVCCPFHPIISFNTKNKPDGIVGKIEQGDSFRIAFGPGSGAHPPPPWIDLTSVDTTTTSPHQVAVKLVHGGAANGNDVLWICGSASGNCGPGSNDFLGHINLGNSTYVAATVVFAATYTWDPVGSAITVTIGPCVNGCPPAIPATPGGASTATFQPQVGGGAVSENGVHF
jgi:hypothetical protein